MKTRQPTEALARVETWPLDIQNELAELDAGVKGDEYRPTEGRVSSAAQVETTLGKFRRA